MSFEGFGELLPEITELNAPFWEGLADGELRLQECGDCGARQHPAESFCYACGGQDVTWRPSAGEGEIYSFIVVHQLYHKAFADHLPYVVAIVQLDDGPRLLGAMLGPDVAPEVGMRVRPSFQKIDNERAILLFEPAR